MRIGPRKLEKTSNKNRDKQSSMSQESMLLKKHCGSLELFPATRKRDNQHWVPIWAKSGLRPMKIKSWFSMVSKSVVAGTSGDSRWALHRAGSLASMFVPFPTLRSRVDQPRMLT